jgi:hypothetical protein
MVYHVLSHIILIDIENVLFKPNNIKKLLNKRINKFFESGRDIDQDVCRNVGRE